MLDAAGVTLYRGEIITDAAEDIMLYDPTDDSSGMYLNGSFAVNRWLYIDDISEG